MRAYRVSIGAGIRSSAVQAVDGQQVALRFGILRTRCTVYCTKHHSARAVREGCGELRHTGAVTCVGSASHRRWLSRTLVSPVCFLCFRQAGLREPSRHSCVQALSAPTRSAEDAARCSGNRPQLLDW